MKKNIDIDKLVVNPEKLVYVMEKEATFECYFNYSRNYSHKYVLSLNGKVIIITIISINRDWQSQIKR